MFQVADGYAKVHLPIRFDKTVVYKLVWWILYRTFVFAAYKSGCHVNPELNITVAIISVNADVPKGKYREHWNGFADRLWRNLLAYVRRTFAYCTRSVNTCIADRRPDLFRQAALLLLGVAARYQLPTLRRALIFDVTRKYGSVTVRI